MSRQQHTARIELPPKLIDIFTGPADVRGAYGGRGSAKTRSFAKMTAVRAHMWDRMGYEGILLCGRQFMNSLDDSSMEEIKAAIRSEPWLVPHFEIGEKYIRTRSGRLAYKFAGLDRSLDSIKSKSRIRLCWVDEAEPVTEEAWVKLIPTLREEDSELWVTWNPESKRSPTHLRFRAGPADPRVKVTELNWRDNPWFPDVLRRTMERDKIARPERFEHIWEGAFAEVFEGAYYTRDLMLAREQGRIGKVDYEPALPVHTAWDLGKGPHMVVWLFQIDATSIRVIDYIDGGATGVIPDVVAKLASRKYNYGIDWVPHDAKVPEMGTGRTRVETLMQMGRKPKLIPGHKVADGINAVHETMPRCWFDAERTEAGLDCLRQYRREYSDSLVDFKDVPLHDWTSHAADAFRYLAMAWREMTASAPKSRPASHQIIVAPDLQPNAQTGEDGINLGMKVSDIVDAIKKQQQAKAKRW